MCGTGMFGGKKHVFVHFISYSKCCPSDLRGKEKKKMKMKGLENER